MAVDITGLETALSPYGTVEACMVNNSTCFIVVVSGVTTDMATLKSICDSYLLIDYPYEEVMTLVDGVFKTEYDNIPT